MSKENGLCDGPELYFENGRYRWGICKNNPMWKLVFTWGAKYFCDEHKDIFFRAGHIEKEDFIRIEKFVGEKCMNRISDSDELEQAYLDDFRQRDFAELGLDRKPVVMRHVALHRILEDGTHEYECVQVHPDEIAEDGSFVVDGVRYRQETEVGDA